MKKVTIQDIADELGYSRNTVSRAINNAGGLADATRDRILSKAAEMGYKQFPYIQALSENLERNAPSRGTVALLSDGTASLPRYAALIMDSLRNELPARGYGVQSFRTDRDDLLRRTLPLSFDPGRIRAVICAALFDRAYDEMLCSLGLPVLFVDGPCKRDGVDLPADQLYMDSTTVITGLVNRMLRCGLRKIGFVGDYESCQSFFERYTAFRLAMLMAGFPADERLCLKTGDRQEIRNGLSEADPPEALICASDQIAADTILALQDLGRSVPGDVRVCGFGDLPNARTGAPALTTVHIHTDVMARSALGLLLSRMEQPNLDCRIVHTETELIIRDSARF